MNCVASAKSNWIYIHSRAQKIVSVDFYSHSYYQSLWKRSLHDLTLLIDLEQMSNDPQAWLFSVKFQTEKESERKL